MNVEVEAAWPADFDASAARFCNSMLMSARSDDGKRLFQEFVAMQATQALAAKNATRSVDVTSSNAGYRPVTHDSYSQ